MPAQRRARPGSTRSRRPARGDIGYVLPIRVEQLEDGRFLGRCPVLPGLSVEAESIDRVLKLAPKVARSLLAAMKSKGVPPPRGLLPAAAPIRLSILVAA